MPCEAPEDALRARPSTPSTCLTFSLTSTMGERVFRTDGGRLFQAVNDEYSFPADDTELERLEVQHRAFKVMQDGKNYLAPFQEVLRDDGQAEKRLLDVGTGTGIWAIEMSIEFPHVQIVGTDLCPVQYSVNVPDNCHFTMDDVTDGLPYPDGYFDAIHLRGLAAGIRDWPALVKEALRVTKSGGLVAFVESAGCAQLTSSRFSSGEALDQITALGFLAYAKTVHQATKIRGMNFYAGADVIPETLEKDHRAGKVTSIPIALPMAPWSKDPVWRRAGEIMISSTRAIPEALRIMTQDACGISSEQYDELSDGFLYDLLEGGVPGVLGMAHVWARKL